jgi:type I restriction enzyme S subunit
MVIELSEKQIQDGWQIVKFGDIAKNISKRVEPSETDLEVYVGLEHLDPQSLRITRRGVPADVKGQKLRVRPGQIIFGKRRAYQKKLAVADFDGICSAHAMVLEEVVGKIISGLLPFFMQSDMFMDRAVAISEGSLSPTIKWKTLAIQEFPLPPIERQKEILEVLEKLEDCAAKFISMKNCRESTYNAMAAQLFTRGISKTIKTKKTRIGMVPEHWEIVQFGSLLLNGTQNGLYKNESSYGSGEKMIHMTEMFRSENVIPEQIEKRVNLTDKEAERYLLNNKDLLFARRSLTPEGAGLCCMYAGENGRASFESSIIRVTLDSQKAMPDFYNQFLRSKVGRWHMQRIIQTVAASGITGTDLKKLKVPLPPLEEQQRIAEILKNFKLADKKTQLSSLRIKFLGRSFMEVSNELQ